MIKIESSEAQISIDKGINSSNGHRHVGKRQDLATMLLATLKRKLLVLTDFSWIMRTAAFQIDIFVIFGFLCLAGVYGYYAILGLFLSQMPVWYLVAKEVWRKEHMLPRSECWETTSEKWSQSFKEYVEKTRRKSKHV